VGDDEAVLQLTVHQFVLLLLRLIENGKIITKNLNSINVFKSPRQLRDLYRVSRLQAYPGRIHGDVHFETIDLHLEL
jgi:hypothetical protein